jgi:hypothetical protein
MGMRDAAAVGLAMLLFVQITFGESAVRRGEKGAVEFIGLENFTPEAIQQKLGYTSIDQMHFCAQDLKAAGFPEVSVFAFRENGKRYTVITLLEPTRARDVKYVPAPLETAESFEYWSDLGSTVRDHQLLSGPVLDYGRTLPLASQSQNWLSDGTDQAWWKIARRYNSPKDLSNAIRALNSAADPYSRMAAVLVTMNFPNRDEAWHALARGLRNVNENVRILSFQALNSWATYFPRRVNWKSAKEDLRTILGGTNLFAFPFLLKVLAATKVDPRLAQGLLASGNGRLVLAYLTAEHKHESELAHEFLLQAAGRDLGQAPENWKPWIDRLR